MKNTFYLIILLLSLTTAQAQITINFIGHNEAGTVNLTTVIVENTSNGESVTLTTNFAVDLVETVNILNIDNKNQFTTNPNPFNTEINLNLSSKVREKANISVFNITGKQVILKTINLKEGNNTIKFHPAYKGIFIINISSKNLSYSKKVVCNNSNSKVFKLEEETNNTAVFSSPKTGKNTLNQQLRFQIGDILKYTGFYSNHISVITDSPTTSHTSDFEFHACMDYENNVYPIVKIGNQWWMAENLKSTQYYNGSSIPENYTYDNNSGNEDIYGRLYTWDAVMNGAEGNNDNPSNVQGACPNGWHVPSEQEWDELRDNLGGKEAMHGKMKETGIIHWNAPNSDATNESGMTALPGGSRWDDGSFDYLGEQAFFWNATDDLSGGDIEHASGYTFFHETSDYYMYTWNLKTMAQSLRCVMN